MLIFLLVDVKTAAKFVCMTVFQKCLGSTLSYEGKNDFS